MLSNVLSISFFSRDEQGNGPIEASFFASMGTVLLYSVIILTGNMVNDVTAAVYHVNSTVDSTGLVEGGGTSVQKGEFRVRIED
jgi:hypothetical protein